MDTRRRWGGGLLDSAVGARSQPIKRKEDVSSESLISLCDNCINNINLKDVTDSAMIVIGYVVSITTIRKSAIHCTFNN